MTIKIINLKTGETADIVRDVCTIHPDWVHAQCGTSSETELQAMLDQFSVEDWYDGDDHKGQDVCGMEMFRE